MNKSTESTGDQTAGANYKKVRNERTTNERRAKVIFFCENIDSTKSTSAHWKILSNTANTKRIPQVRPTKLNDKTLAVRDKD